MKFKILIVEDEPFLVEMYKTRLEQEGHTVLNAPSGDSVLDLVLKEKPDVVFLDIIMPEKDGYTVLQELKKNETTNTIPIIIFSNLAQEHEIQRGLELGADEYLIKSDYTPKQLAEKVEKIIAGKK